MVSVISTETVTRPGQDAALPPPLSPSLLVWRR